MMLLLGIPLSRIHEITKIDMWFLKQYEELYREKFLLIKWMFCQKNYAGSKTKGFADRQIAHMMGCLKSSAY
jgi:carbamoyl-phosphate synthase large subunit